MEDYSYSLALKAIKAQGVNTVGVPMDAKGILPEALGEILEKWVGPKPKLLYTI